MLQGQGRARRLATIRPLGAATRRGARRQGARALGGMKAWVLGAGRQESAGVGMLGAQAHGTAGGLGLDTARLAHDTTVRSRPCAAWAWPVHTWACCWAVGCALGALGVFLTRLDSVLFLSHMNTVYRKKFLKFFLLN